MYITPKDVKEYSEFRAVQNRPDPKLEKDILRAETEIFAYCGHKFDNATKYPNGPPEEVKLAFILLAEYYALIAANESLAKGFKSEKIGGYSYSIGDNPMNKPSFISMLSAYVQTAGMAKRKVDFRMRGL
ncbi:protein YqbG [Aneurinibacillus migulanus]|uniref:DUF3199 family protein n=1 Tax=Aneurinibacillus migulanus TaxID=47500 RepID=A0A0D1WNM3_ANEMI|nr:DUF3199 family protein [Aneurinibacillus migulanus]KIV60285.1 hypothetical protein TS65_00420 [Aneurinibacillus migulanus]KON90516.1 hypothetical protein AF333_28985 [Aneurinibacillus migulanus]MED0894901.1 DUF3199 family protein [Aneurinibacillus migulanus]MED1614456.1 DUF3199 family protein [Aneurinibacillus migulanus]SDJ77188.1 Protein of unknown function [Aneurinibacillus migulanus]